VCFRWRAAGEAELSAQFVVRGLCVAEPADCVALNGTALSRLTAYIVKRNLPAHSVFASDRFMSAQPVHIFKLSNSGVCRSSGHG
jgi:hypothetical protein